MDVLITAGATRNPVDAIRYLSAHATGTTGVTIARAVAARGASPWLLGSAEARLRAPELPGDEYFGTRDLMTRMEAWIRAHPKGTVVHSSAVGDYELAEPLKEKIPSGLPSITLTLVPAPKIADRVRDWGHTGPFVTFKAAPPGTTDDELVGIASRQRDRVRCDRVFANVIGRTDRGVWLVGDDAVRFERRADAVESLIRWLAP